MSAGWNHRSRQMDKLPHNRRCGGLSFGEPFHCLRDGTAHAWMGIARGFGKALALLASVGLYISYPRLFQNLLPEKLIKQYRQHQHMSASKARERLASNTDRPDFVTPARGYSDPLGSISVAKWEANLAIIAFAASETTSFALTAIIRELIQHENVLETLTLVIRHAFTQEADIKISSTEKIPYSNAVINEGLRLDPPVVVGIPRVVPKHTTSEPQICSIHSAFSVQTP